MCSLGLRISQRLFKKKKKKSIFCPSWNTSFRPSVLWTVTAPSLHYAPGPSASSLLTQKLDKKATVRKKQDAETEIHGSSCWAKQLIRGNKFVPWVFVGRSGQWPSSRRGEFFVRGVIRPSGPFSIPCAFWPLLLWLLRLLGSKLVKL